MHTNNGICITVYMVVGIWLNYQHGYIIYMNLTYRCNTQTSSGSADEAYTQMLHWEWSSQEEKGFDTEHWSFLIVGPTNTLPLPQNDPPVVFLPAV